MENESQHHKMYNYMVIEIHVLQWILFILLLLSIYIFYHQLFLNSILSKKSAYLFSSPKLTHIYSQMQWSLNGKLKMSRKFLAGESSTIQSREHNCFQTNALWTIFLSKFFINDTVGLGPEEKPFRIIKIIYGMMAY